MIGATIHDIAKGGRIRVPDARPGTFRDYDVPHAVKVLAQAVIDLSKGTRA